MLRTKKRKKSLPPAARHDGWDDWRPVWTGKPHATPHDCQEHHAPTEPVYLRTTQSRKTERGTRRIVDARLWDAMTPAQQDAALEVTYALHLVTRGIGFRSSPISMHRFDGGPVDETEYQAMLTTTYFSWAKTAKREDIVHAAVIDILALGKSCKQVDREREMRNSWARGNLMAGLSLYCRLRGWPY